MRTLPLLILLLGANIYAQEPAPDPSNEPVPVPPGVGEVEKKLEFLERADKIVGMIRDNKRQMDPFGMPMDPTNTIETPILAEQYGELDEVPVLNNSSLKNALNTLPISGIYPKKRVVVLGARSFNQGETFGMKLEELTIRLRFEGIKGKAVYFKDLDTQEIASVDFATKPAEFEPITRGSSPAPLDGIQPMDGLFIVN